MKAEEKPRRKGGRSLGIRSNTPSSRAMYGAMPAVASTTFRRLELDRLQDLQHQMPHTHLPCQDWRNPYSKQIILRQPALMQRACTGC